MGKMMTALYIHTHTYTYIHTNTHTNTYIQLKELILKRRSQAMGKMMTALTAVEAFAIGAIARGIATIIVFPYTRAKVCMYTCICMY